MSRTNVINIAFTTTIDEAITFADDISNTVSTNDTSLTNYKGIGIVYFMYLFDKNTRETKLVYIGKSKGYIFKTRIRNHIFKKHPKTGSKLANVKAEIVKGNEIKIKFLKVNPESFRNTLEEELINHYRPSWNIQKRRKE
ncbi:GIY-YIG nuclease family protein [Nonlabens sp. Asnod3-A02]|uniref:GIY-YIG nuclease family protein n=1 Tax=Nonlabens sp. Asnod3-A02 TaxID=3160579 RepID=UPI00386F3B57